MELLASWKSGLMQMILASFWQDMISANLHPWIKILFLEVLYLSNLLQLIQLFFSWEVGPAQMVRDTIFMLTHKVIYENKSKNNTRKTKNFKFFISTGFSVVLSYSFTSILNKLHNKLFTVSCCNSVDLTTDDASGSYLRGTYTSNGTIYNSRCFTFFEFLS